MVQELEKAAKFFGGLSIHNAFAWKVEILREGTPCHGGPW